MAHAQKPDFIFRRNERVHLNRRGRQFSRLLAAEMCTTAVVMLDTPCFEVLWRVLSTHSIRQFPPSLPRPCVTLRHQISNGLYQVWVIYRAPATLLTWFDSNLQENGRCTKFLLSTNTQWSTLPFQCALNTWHSSCSVVKQVSAMSKESMITALSSKQFVRSLVKLGRWECHCSVISSLQALGLPGAFKDNVSTTKSTRTFTTALLYIFRDGPRPHLRTSLNTSPPTSVRAARTILVSL